ncbi:MAG: peptidase T [Ruminococcaceae bacterium]|nr:peptidase T [Oscillospiraceae bacterium]
MRAYERLIKYTEFETGSDENNLNCPSSPEQLKLAEYLVSELKGMGIDNATVDENSYVYAKIPANSETITGKTIGFIAHLDTISDVEFRNVRPKVIENYDGNEIVLNEENKVIMPPLEKYKGCSLVVTDGMTILGADNKAGIAEIMTMAERLMNDPTILHGEVCIGFTPDEEINRGAERFDIVKFGADYAYTLDGGDFGQVEYETFNAVNAKVTIKGKSVHTGTAKQGGMKNANNIAMEFDSMLPENERPEYTEGHEGFYHLMDVTSDVEKAEMRYLLRDFDSTKIKIKRAMLEKVAEFLNTKYGNGTVKVELFDRYQNMAEMILPHMHLIENAKEAVKNAGGEVEVCAIRGGTDGAQLSFMGLPCPNLGTGSGNHHGRHEYAVVEDMDKAVEMIINIVKAYR